MLNILIEKEVKQILNNKFVYLSMLACGLVITILFSMISNNNDSIARLLSL